MGDIANSFVVTTFAWRSPPERMFTTLLSMQLIYRLACVFSNGGVELALKAGAFACYRPDCLASDRS
jgi:hypothetical protein